MTDARPAREEMPARRAFRHQSRINADIRCPEAGHPRRARRPRRLLFGNEVL
jgi:hypothetical protein